MNIVSKVLVKEGDRLVPTWVVGTVVIANIRIVNGLQVLKLYPLLFKLNVPIMKKGKYSPTYAKVIKQAKAKYGIASVECCADRTGYLNSVGWEVTWTYRDVNTEMLLRVNRHNGKCVNNDTDEVHMPHASQLGRKH